MISPFAAAALRLLILTGARLREILHLQWEHVDLETGLLRLPDSKTGKKVIVLSAPAAAVLASLAQIDDNPYVIPGDKENEPRADLNKPWRLVRDRAGLKGVRIHDLRHTNASLGAASGLSLPLIGGLLGHTQASTTQRYAHLSNDPLRQAAEKIGARAAKALDGEPPGPSAKVLPMGRKKR